MLRRVRETNTTNMFNKNIVIITVCYSAHPHIFCVLRIVPFICNKYRRKNINLFNRKLWLRDKKMGSMADR